MAQVISLESRLGKVMPRPYFQDMEFEYCMTPQRAYALDFIQQYNNLNNQNKYVFPILITSEIIKKIYDYDLVETLRDKFNFSWNSIKNRENGENGTFLITDPKAFNIIHNYFGYNSSQIADFIYDFYIQMFIDFYNDEKVYLKFPDKRDARKNAMSRGDGKLISALNNIHKIYGFTSNSVLILN